MKCVGGVDLGSTSAKAVLLSTSGELLGRGTSPIRSEYPAAARAAMEQAVLMARSRGAWADLMDQESRAQGETDVVSEALHHRLAFSLAHRYSAGSSRTPGPIVLETVADLM